jgi:hypothetical protein
MYRGTISGPVAMHIDDFDFDLPRERIALHPCVSAPRRDPTHKLPQDIELVCRFASGTGSRSAPIGTRRCGKFARFINRIGQNSEGSRFGADPHAPELGEEPVPGVLYDPAAMLPDFRIDQLAECAFSRSCVPSSSDQRNLACEFHPTFPLSGA